MAAARTGAGSTAKKSTAKKSTAKKSTAKKSTAKNSTAKNSTAKKSTAAKKPASKKAPTAKSAAPYTKPALRERLKKRITAGTKGGKAGQWSARKAQLLAAEYEKAGGGYRAGAKSTAQRSLKRWTKEEWTTADGAPAKRAGGMTRYLPKKAWSKLSAAEKRATETKKRAGSKRGTQFVANTAAAKRARKSATRAST